MKEYEIFFDSEVNHLRGRVIGWSGKMALVDWPRQVYIKKIWRGDRGHYAFSDSRGTMEEHQSWVNPEDPGYRLQELANVWNMALNALEEGIRPGQEIALVEKNGKKVVIKRDKTEEKIDLVYLDTLNGRTERLHFAGWESDLTYQSGRKAKWVVVEKSEYDSWVERTK